MEDNLAEDTQVLFGMQELSFFERLTFLGET